MQHVRSDDGFTLIELMIVVLIMGILVAIAIPVFVGARDNAQRKACFSNERIVEGSYNRLVSTSTTASAITTWPQLMSAVIPSEVASEPLCPSGGTYAWGSRMVICSKHGSYHQ